MSIEEGVLSVISLNLMVCIT